MPSRNPAAGRNPDLQSDRRREESRQSRLGRRQYRRHLAWSEEEALQVTKIFAGPGTWCWLGLPAVAALP